MGIWDKLRYWTSGEVEHLDDPDLLLQQAQREMREVHTRTRERAVQAITKKNMIEQALREAERRRDDAFRRAAAAEEDRDAREAELCGIEAAEYERTVADLAEAFEAASQAAESVKAEIKSEEERIRRRTAEALAIRAQWKANQVQRSLLASLVEVNTGTADTLTPLGLQRRHARNRRLVLDALTQRNNLVAMLEDTEKRVTNLRDKATLAGRRGDGDLEIALLREMEQYEATLAGTREALARAADVTERAVTLIREEEARLRDLGLDPLAGADEDEAAVTAAVPLRDRIPDWAVPLMMALAFLVLAVLIALLA